MTGQLFTHYFLTDGIKATTEWPASAAYCAAFRQSLAQAYETFRQHHQPNEALTEQDLIRPVLDLLGWADYLPQQGADRKPGHPRPSVIRRRRVQDSGRRPAQPRRTLP